MNVFNATKLYAEKNDQDGKLHIFFIIKKEYNEKTIKITIIALSY